MPPKKTKITKGKKITKNKSKETIEIKKNKEIDNEVNDNNNVDEVNDKVNDEDEGNDARDIIPELESVSDVNNLKEKYEYKPVIRSEIVYKLPEDRITSEVMTKFELTEVISIRAKQIENDISVIFVDVENLTDPIEIAKKEIIEKKCPLSIVRMITDKIAEKWHVNEMAIPYELIN